MELITLNRLSSVGGVTLGSVWIGKTFECYWKQRGTPRADGYTVLGEATTPDGRYNVSVVESHRYGRLMPLAMCTGTSDGSRPKVGFYFSPGHHMHDAETAVVLGQVQHPKNIGRTKLAFDAFFAKVAAAVMAGEAVDLEIA